MKTIVFQILAGATAALGLRAGVTFKNTSLRRVALTLLAVCWLLVQAIGGTWTPLAHTPPSSSGGLMLLLTDGTVMVKSAAGGGDGFGNIWYKLTPDSAGSYVNGTWTTLAPMADTRLYFSSQVLKDGRVFVAGGEYGTGGAKGETYNPLTNTWTSAPTQGSTISDANSELLPDGRVLVALVTGSLRSTIIFDPSTNTWTAGPTANGIHNESAWVKLPDGSSLMVDRLSTNSERYIPSLNQWVVDATVSVALYDAFGDETGPGFLLPDGRAFFIGSPSNTAYYTPSGTTAPGIWAAGPTIPGGQGAPDAPGAMMPNGKILCALSPTPTSANHFPSPTAFYEFDYTAGANGTFTAITAPGGAASLAISSYVTNMLVLPDGSVLYSQQGSLGYYIYSSGGTPLASGKPTISSISKNGDGSYHLTGTKLNGISQGAAYGDDWQMSTNYPIVRLTSGSNVYYARTYNWISVGVMTGNTPVTTEFTLPAGLPLATYTLTVIANGISSDPQFLDTTGAPTVSTPTSTSVTSTSVTLGGNVVSDGGQSISERGVVYSATSVNSDPLVGGTGVTKVTSAGTTGIFTVNATGLTVGAGYSFKAYATNSAGTTYTTPVSIFTQGTPTVTTPTSASITASSATLGGNVTNDAGSLITERGVVYSVTTVNADPLIGGTGVTMLTNVGTTGVFTVNATGLVSVTGYSFKAYAINSAGTIYTSPVSSFTTLAVPPTVAAPTQTAITQTNATLGGNVTSDGGATINERGVVYSITSVNSNPIIGGTGVTKITGVGTTGAFTVNVTGLTQNTGYSFNAYAINSSGTTYTTPVSTFTTLAAVPITGTKTVGTGGNYTSLTNSGGLFEAINGNGVNGALSVQIISNLTAETGTIALNAMTGTSPSLKIFPTGAARVISGSIAGALIRLNGADNVTLDGSLGSTGADRSLTITNTSTANPTVIALISLGTGLGATNDVIKNCNISTGVATTISYGICVGGSTPGSNGADNDNVTIQNNSIIAAPVGVYAAGTASTSAGGDDNLSIIGNSITYNSTLASIGIQVGNALNSSVSQNTISEQTTVIQAPTAISIETGFVSSSVARNIITKSLTTNTGGYSGRGITVGTGTATSALTIANNIIYGVNGSNWSAFTDSSAIGIAIGTIGNSSTLTTPAGGIKLYYNSVNMTGSIGNGSTAALTAAIYIGSGASALDMRNNVFVNTQVGTSATQKNYAIYSDAAITAFTTIDYNDYFVSNSFNGASAIPGFLTSDRGDLAAIQAAFGQNSHSFTGDPLLTSATDLHITSLASPVSNTGTPIAGITTDFDGDTRSASTPDIGADEFASLPLVSTPTQTAITASIATLGGNVTGDGGGAITERGVVYSVTTTNSDPLIGGMGVTKVTNAGTTGIFTVSASSLAPGSGYSFKAYATNSAGTTYTTPVSTFTTVVLTVTSLNRVNATPSNAVTVNWTLTFSSAVTGVTASNFSLSGTATSGASIGTPNTTDSGVTWNVPVSSGSSDGTLTLNLANATGFSQTVSTTLPFAGQTYTMDKTTQTPTLTAPTTNAVTGSPVAVSFLLPETALANSLKLTFTGGAVRTLNLAGSQETSGAHSFNFNPANPTAAANVAGIVGGPAIPDGAYTVTLSYQDVLSNGAVTAVSTNVQIDTTAPTLNIPAPITVTATSPTGAVVNYTFSPTDPGGSGIASSSAVPASGTTFPLGTTTVNATATDNAGNIANGSFTITVNPNPPPTGGTLTINPNTGVHQGDLIALSAAGWTDPDLPLTYQFFNGVTALNSPGAATSLNISAPVPGGYTIKVRVTDSAGSFTDATQPLTVVPFTAIETWRKFYFGDYHNTGNGADNFDFDSDGVKNGAEFAFGTDPTSGSSGPPFLQYAGTFAGGGGVTSTGQPKPAFESIPTGVDFRILFNRRVDYVAAGITYIPEFSADGITWFPSVAEPALLATNGTMQVVSVPYPRFVGGKKARFAHVVVVIAP